VHFCLPFRNKARYLKVFNPKARNMKKVSILLIALLAIGGLRAQSELKIVVDKLEPAKKVTLSSASVASLKKTAADNVVVDSTIVFDCAAEVGEDYLLGFFPSVFTTSLGGPPPKGGYFAGTSTNAFNLTICGSDRFHGFGNLFTVNGSGLTNANPKWNGATSRGAVYLDEIILPSNGDDPLYFAKKSGLADTFVVRVWQHSGHEWNASTAATCVSTSPAPVDVKAANFNPLPAVYSEQKFTIDDLQNQLEPHRIVFDNPILLTADSFWVYIRVDTTGNDDTLAPALVDGSLAIGNGNFECGSKNHSFFGLYSRLNNNSCPTYQRISTVRKTTTTNCPEDYVNSEFLLFPVIRTDTQNVPYVGRAGLRQGNITINNIYPNPSVGRVSVSYDLNAPTKVAFRILDNKLRIIEQVERGLQPAGNYAYEFNTSNMAAGMYYLQTSHNGQVLTQKFSVAK
jgi:hypothetical protein